MLYILADTYPFIMRIQQLFKLFEEVEGMGLYGRDIARRIFGKNKIILNRGFMCVTDFLLVLILIELMYIEKNLK